MKIKGFHIELLFFLFIALISCKKNDEGESLDFGYDYYPVGEGRFVTYRYTEIQYDDFFEPVKVDTFQYLLKVRIDSSNTNSEGDYELVLHRLRKNNDTSGFKLVDVWSANRLAERLEVVEENVRIIKLVFPIRETNVWDGNAFNVSDEENYSIVESNGTELIQNNRYNSVVKIIQRNAKTLISEEFAEEWYAEDIGMIYKAEKSVRTAVDGSIVSGFERKFEIVDYGSE